MTLVISLSDNVCAGNARLKVRGCQIAHLKREECNGYSGRGAQLTKYVSTLQ